MIIKLNAHMQAAGADPDVLPRPVGFSATGKRNNCGIVALAALTGIDYQQCEDAIWQSIAERGARKHRNRWSGYINTHADYPRAAALLGVRMKYHRLDRRCRVTTFARRHDPDTRVIVSVPCHVMTLYRGHLMDQDGTFKIDPRHRKSRRMVTGYWTLAANHTNREE